MNPPVSDRKGGKRRKRKYRLIKADAFTWLAKRRATSVQAIVTDPPYGLIEYQPEQIEKRENGNGGWCRLPPKFDGYDRRLLPRFTALTGSHLAALAAFHANLAPALLRVLVPGGHVIMATQTLLSHIVIGAFVEAGFELRGQVARAVSTFRGGDRPKFAHRQYAELSVIPRSAWEPWLILRKPCEGLVRDNLRKWGTGALRRPSKHTPFRDFIASGPARNPERTIADHPSLKPQAFMRQVVAAALPLGKGVIVDPFAGSGATLAAAEALNLRSIGVEKHAAYYRMAKAAIPLLAALTPNGNGRGNGDRGVRDGSPPAAREKSAKKRARNGGPRKS